MQCRVSKNSEMSWRSLVNFRFIWWGMRGETGMNGDRPYKQYGMPMRRTEANSEMTLLIRYDMSSTASARSLHSLTWSRAGHQRDRLACRLCRIPARIHLRHHHQLFAKSQSVGLSSRSYTPSLMMNLIQVAIRE